MSENASHIIIHHYFENSSGFGCFGSACCVILIVVIVLLLLIVLGLIIYIIACFSPRRRRSRHAVPRRKVSRRLHGYDNAVTVSPCDTAAATTSTERDVVLDDNAQSIPMTPLGTRRDSSDSSAGLYDVLFPDRHDGEVLYGPPSKLMTFAGQVYSGSEAGPSSRRPSESLAWDYFQQSAAHSEAGSDPSFIDNICWV